MNSITSYCKPKNKSQERLIPPVGVYGNIPLLLPSAFSELFASASHSGSLTQADRYGLMAALLEESLQDEERSALDRLLYAVQKGRVTPVNEISVRLQA